MMRYLPLMIFTFFVNSAIGQAFDFTQYGIEEGIAHEQVTDICQDVKGNLWIATQGGGVSKFNGISFENYTVRDGLLSNYVRKLTTDDQGNVWMATAKGISKFNGVEIERDHVLRNTPKNSINSILVDSDQNIWYAAGEKGISTVDRNGLIQSFNQSNGFVNDRALEIKEGQNGDIWIVTIVNGLYRYKDNTFTKMVATADIKGYILSVTPYEDYVLIATNRGVFKYAAELTYLEEFSNMFIKAITPRKDELWLVTANTLILNQNERNKEFTETEGFSSKLATTTFADREGNMWIGTNGDGVYKFTNSAFVKFDKRQGLVNENIFSVLKDDLGQYWYGTNGGGIYLYDGVEMKSYTTSDGLPSNYITSSTKDVNGDLWFGTRGGGVVNYSNGIFKIYLKKDGLIHNNIRSMYTSSNGDIWISTINGLSIWNGKSFKCYSKVNGLLDNVVWNILERDNQIYIVTRNGINVYSDDKLDSFYEDADVFSKRVNTIRFSSNNELLIGYSGHGFRILNLNNSTSELITTEDGLISDIIHDIVQIDIDKYLITTERGIDILALNKGKVLSVSHLANKNSGLGLAKTNPGAIFRDNEKIWIGTQDGVYCYEIGLDETAFAPPIINISAINLLPEKDRDVEFDSDTKHDLKYTQNSLEISYFGNCLNDAENIVYQYKLTNFQEDWSLPSKSTNTMFTNLPSGDYSFQVRASTSNGTFSQTPAHFNFKIIPPIWEQPWLYLLLTLLVVSLVRYGYLFRIKANILRVLELEKIREEEATKVRETMARDFHDNMGNQLASITVFSNLISLKLKNQTIEIDDLLQNIEKHSKSLYNGTKDFIWSMNPESDNLSEIFIYIKDFGEDFFAKTNVDFYAENEASGMNIAVPSGWSRQIVLIFKEAMTNSLKHSQTDKIYLSLQLEDNTFVIKCTDDGIGVDEDEFKGGNGHQNMNTRAKQIGCDLLIRNKDDGSGIIVFLSGVIPKKESSVGLKIF